MSWCGTLHGKNAAHAKLATPQGALLCPPCKTKVAWLSQDKAIGKRVFCISGSVPAANYVQLPKTKGPILGLTGQFLYLQV